MDISEVDGTAGRRDTAFVTTGLEIIFPIFAVVINTCNFKSQKLASGPQTRGKQCRDEKELESSNSATSTKGRLV